MCWNQPARVDHLRKKCKVGQKKFKKKGASRPCPGINPRPVGTWSRPGDWTPTMSLAQGRPATSGRPPAAGRHLDRVGLLPFFLNFLIFLKLPPILWSNFYWKFGEWAKAWVHKTPIFSSFPLHL
jgi:hypothetical protein